MQNSKYCEKKIHIALFGNPIEHSLSPLIHKNFSKEIKINYNYNSFLCTKSNFFVIVKNFFQNGGFGCNITVPFKKKSFQISNKNTKYVKISNSVNVLKKSSNNNIIGYNTDGIGLIYDLNRLKYITENSFILILGSGGAVYSIVYHLLKKKCCIFILNRTISKSCILVNKFKKFGKIFVFDKNLYTKKFDIIINATSCGLYNFSPKFPKNLIFPNTKCYDISYSKNKKLTPFLSTCRDLGSRKYSDGLGMLVAQAAYSCYIWFNILPNIKKNINLLKSII
ncbi:shikimate dehydrogenase [Buchnera aphidicola]|uniref:Shikimate dehydrogenase (NADP(+)) n=2 Tax=Buchnera aphidicola (Cinara cedri) TaxID=261318 RepID=AROE_BUCCC|nr:shikimate dehydrogenase [Buchnera aphidicola]Q057D3.1 RecName: Full=Shikimate dehydrogenase (NADP(+)); Short=SDH [Buchnera aphidicola BCc]AAW72678.1 shikimate 5-dehydrogenase [Buchnera aphidicola (Cinara cedri)]ABJ90766.1 shikimate 5-dehydrogenase [Buchnera aphidicola BCc]